MNATLTVALGGALGAVFRHWVGVGSVRVFGSAFPYGTLTVNLVGSLFMGLLIGWMAQRGGTEGMRLFLAVGVLGGFTTFSAFSLDAIRLLEAKAYVGFATYVGISVGAGLIALLLGLWMMRMAL